VVIGKKEIQRIPREIVRWGQSWSGNYQSSRADVAIAIAVKLVNLRCALRIASNANFRYRISGMSSNQAYAVQPAQP
jgi:hypothetical protein